MEAVPADLGITIVFLNMPRRYYRRRTIVRAPRKKWATNITTRNYTILPGSSDPLNKVPYIQLVSNASQSSSPTPVIVKAGNFKVNADVSFLYSATSANEVHLVAFVVFLPEGIVPADNQQFGNLITAHPEYILAWRQLDAERIEATNQNVARNLDRVTFSSRLKRNLNSGDSIVFGILDQSSNTVTQVRVSLTCQYWTCSN